MKWCNGILDGICTCIMWYVMDEIVDKLNMWCMGGTLDGTMD